MEQRFSLSLTKEEKDQVFEALYGHSLRLIDRIRAMDLLRLTVSAEQKVVVDDALGELCWMLDKISRELTVLDRS